jgi:hypothetical protein
MRGQDLEILREPQIMEIETRQADRTPDSAISAECGDQGRSPY